VLAALGVGHAFGVVGSGNFHVTNALRAAACRYTRRPARGRRRDDGRRLRADVRRGRGAVGAPGPGCTNALTGITEAARAAPRCWCWPPTPGGGGALELPIDQDAAGRARWARCPSGCTRPLGGGRRLRGLRHLREQRRTVVLNLPLDVQAQPCPRSARAARRGSPLPARGGRARSPSWPDCSTGPSAGVHRRRGARHAAPELAALAEPAGAAGHLARSANGLFAGRPGRWASPAASPRRWPPS
jgi:hypothetical protein